MTIYRNQLAELVRMEVRTGEVGGSIPATTRFWKNTDKSGEQVEGCHEGTQVVEGRRVRRTNRNFTALKGTMGR